MVGGERALALADARQPIGIGRPLIDIDGVADTEPGGVGMVVDLFGQPQLPFQQRRPATGVHYPTSADLPWAALALYLHTMSVALVVQGDLLDLAAIHEGNTLLLQFLAQSIL